MIRMTNPVKVQHRTMQGDYELSATWNVIRSSDEERVAEEEKASFKAKDFVNHKRINRLH